MGKLFTLIGCFLLGVGAVGLFSFTAYAFPNLRMYGVWLIIVVGILSACAISCDEFFCEALGLTEKQWHGIVFTTIAVFILGGVIQWLK
ncbi:MAG TPA: hypothetical protein V6D12_01800 [Candidatus Obscuribacterales bacterium]